VQVDQINLSGIVERYIVFKTSGSIKERTQTSTEMGAGCQRNGLEIGVGRDEEVCRKSCPYIRQLANSSCIQRFSIAWLLNLHGTYSVAACSMRTE